MDKLRGKSQQKDTVIERRNGVLIVADDGLMSDLLCALLSEQGHEVRAVTSAREAIDALRAAPAALLLLDLDRRTSDGWDELRLLRAVAGRPPIHVLTTVKSDVRRARHSGAGGVIMKPFDIDEVLSLAKRHDPVTKG